MVLFLLPCPICGTVCACVISLVSGLHRLIQPYLYVEFLSVTMRKYIPNTMFVFLYGGAYEKIRFIGWLVQIIYNYILSVREQPWHSETAMDCRSAGPAINPASGA